MNSVSVYIATAQEQFAWIAEEEIRAADPKGTVTEGFPDGVFLFESSLEDGELIGILRNSPPVFLRHIQPAELSFHLPKSGDGPKSIAEACASLVDRLPESARVAVQVRQVPGEKFFSNFSVKEKIDPLLIAAGKKPTVKDPEWIVSVFIAGAVCHAGLSTPGDNLNERSGGIVRFAKEAGRVSRSEHKILEAIELGMLPIKAGEHALDIGAAPGGWTRILHQKGCRVVAVDPAELSPAVTALPGVSYVRGDASHYPGGVRFDLITDDMNWDPAKSARALKHCAKKLKKGGRFLMTVKLGGERPDSLIARIKGLLSPELTVLGARQLYHNRNEATLWGTRS